MNHFDVNTSTAAFNDRLERTKELCKRQLRTQVEATVDHMFSFFRDEFNVAVQRYSLYAESTAQHGVQAQTAAAHSNPSPQATSATLINGSSAIQNAILRHHQKHHQQQHDPPSCNESTSNEPLLGDSESCDEFGDCDCNECNDEDGSSPVWSGESAQAIKQEVIDIDQDLEGNTPEALGPQKKQKTSDAMSTAPPTSSSTSSLKFVKTNDQSNYHKHHRRHLHNHLRHRQQNHHTRPSSGQPLTSGQPALASGQSSENPPGEPLQVDTRPLNTSNNIANRAEIINPINYGASTSTSSPGQVVVGPIKPYWCRFEGCNRSFTAPAHLKEHENIHLGVRPYRCKWPDCGYDSTQRNNVITHIRGKHFNLPPTIKEQRERNIRDNRDPSKFLEIRTELLR